MSAHMASIITYITLTQSNFYYLNKSFFSNIKAIILIIGLFFNFSANFWDLLIF